jgi:hypothetical protein
VTMAGPATRSSSALDIGIWDLGFPLPGGKG